MHVGVTANPVAITDALPVGVFLREPVRAAVKSICDSHRALSYAGWGAVTGRPPQMVNLEVAALRSSLTLCLLELFLAGAHLLAERLGVNI
jgi:hypothetical protein